jgi:hypothetical protein
MEITIYMNTNLYVLLSSAYLFLPLDESISKKLDFFSSQNLTSVLGSDSVTGCLHSSYDSASWL